MFPARAVAHNAHFVPIFFSAGGVNASADVSLYETWVHFYAHIANMKKKLISKGVDLRFFALSETL